MTAAAAEAAMAKMRQPVVVAAVLRNRQRKKKGSTRRKNSKRVARRRYVAVQVERNNKPAFLSFIPRALAFSNPRARQRGALQASARYWC